MAKKKRKRRDDRPKSRPRRPPPPQGLRAVEGMMAHLMGEVSGRDVENAPLARAQEIVYQAFAEPSERRRVQFAREALALSPDCADAYVVLAEHADDRREALDLYRQGVAAGERALGPQAFEQHAGHFWGMFKTRPYMRAREGLAEALWCLGRREEAVQHLQDMLRLNPNDNQSLRYTLAGHLLFLDRDDDLARLVEQFAEDDMASWAYTRALLAFRRQGDTPESRRLLAKARKTNTHVPPYLLGSKYPPSGPLQPYQAGDEDEALNYIRLFMSAWIDTAGAIAWLRANVHPRKSSSDTPAAKGPLGFIKKWLNERLPQDSDIWQAECRLLPNWILGVSEPYRPWAILVVSASNDLILAHELTQEAPSPAMMWDTLVQAMQNPAAGEPHRPRELQVRADERWQSLQPHLEQIGVNFVEGQELEMLDAMLDDMTMHLCGKPRPGMLDMPGVTPEQVASFFQAAAGFFRQSPWKKVGYESPFRVECDKFHSGPWYGVLMGQLGLTRGLAVYDDLATLRGMWAEDDDDDKNARRSVGTSVTFDEPWGISVADYEAAQHHGWEVARPDAYPSVFHKERGMTTRPPLAWELELVEGCLRTVPDFLSRRQQDDATSEEFTVLLASGPLRLVLSWVVDAGERVG